MVCSPSGWSSSGGVVEEVERGFVEEIRASRADRPCIATGTTRRLYAVGYKSAKQSPAARRCCFEERNLLLNIPVRGDGTIDDKEEAVLDGITTWMARNGEAIFGTRPWRVFGEGPTRPPAGEMNEQDAKPFTAEDLRFTQKDGRLYAIFLDWPKGEAAIASLGTNRLPNAVIEQVQLLGGSPLKFRREGDALRVSLPPADLFVPALRISGRGLG